jgi:hypothetical protein
MPRIVLLVSENRFFAGVALRTFGRFRQPAWVFSVGGVGSGVRSRWRAGVVRPESDELPAAIIEAARIVGATHVVPDSVDMFAEVAAIADELAPAATFPSCSATELLRYDDKRSFASASTELGLPVVPTYAVDERASRLSHDFDYPVIVKPATSENREGQTICHRRDDLVAMASTWPEGPQIIQPYVAGSDVHVTFLADHGDLIAWEIREPLTPTRPTPGMFRFFHDDEALDITRRWALGTGFHGLGNLDLRRDAATGSLALLECNPRLYGTLDFAAHAGVNFLELGLDLADGRRPDAPVVTRPGVVYSAGGVRQALRRAPRSLVHTATLRAATVALADISLTLDMARRATETMVQLPT